MSNLAINQNEPRSEQSVSLQSLLHDILLSHVILRESAPRSTSSSTYIRVHVIPYTSVATQQNQTGTTRVVFSSTPFSNNRGSKRNVHRNRHVSHLPPYQKIKDSHMKDEFSCELCPVCHDTFKLGEYFRTLPICGHTFHKRCVDRWLRQDRRRMSCPVCRTNHLPANWLTYQQEQENIGNDSDQNIEVEIRA